MIAVVAVLIAAAGQAPHLPDLLSRLSEEAEMYRRMAPQTLSEETFEQRAFTAGPAPGQVRLQTREIVSEYGVGFLKEAPDSLHEFRQVIAVDGRPVASPEKARHSLSLGLHSPDDRVRKRMLEDFQAHGLAGAAVDFGPLILLFTKRQLENYRYTLADTAWVGAEEAVVLSYRQAGGPQNVTVFAGRKAIRLPLEGLVVLRKTDGLPLRVTLRAARTERRQTFVEEASVDYMMTRHGCLAPAAVLHRTLVDGRIVTENCFRYAEFRRFGAESEIKFTEVPEKP